MRQKIRPTGRKPIKVTGIDPQTRISVRAVSLGGGPRKCGGRKWGSETGNSRHTARGT